MEYGWLGHWDQNDDFSMGYIMKPRAICVKKARPCVQGKWHRGHVVFQQHSRPKQTKWVTHRETGVVINCLNSYGTLLQRHKRHSFTICLLVNADSCTYCVCNSLENLVMPPTHSQRLWVYISTCASAIVIWSITGMLETPTEQVG